MADDNDILNDDASEEEKPMDDAPQDDVVSEEPSEDEPVIVDEPDDLSESMDTSEADIGGMADSTEDAVNDSDGADLESEDVSGSELPLSSQDDQPDNTMRNIIIAVVILIVLFCCCCVLLFGALGASGVLEEIGRELGVSLQVIPEVI